ncbi:MAG: glycosyltransferase family 2 protein [Deltaproteobacteria bacterium]|nr:glycosyltransferase family 2 protein [Deltaproteobacteria bacterium]
MASSFDTTAGTPSAPAAARVAVVVLDWNGGAETLLCLERLHETRSPDLRVYLVDNASREPVQGEAKRRFPEVVAIRNERNLGYAGGNNVGIRAALADGAEWVLVLNNDAFVRPDTIVSMLAAGARRNDDGPVAAVGARILRADEPGCLWMAWGEVTYRQSLVRLVGEGERDGPEFASDRDVPWVSGAAILLSRHALEDVGLFDEAYFAYHEEVDWCARARERGFRVVYAGAAAVEHRGEASSGGRSYVGRKQYLAARNMVRFVRRHGSPAERFRFAAFLVGTLPLQLVKRTFTAEQYGVWLKIRGIADALRERPIPRGELGLDG